ncbi:uncharacterized protein ACBT44_022671 [Syngnathus typhle]
MDSNMTNPIQIPENKKHAGYRTIGHHSQVQKSSTERTSRIKEKHNCRERERRKKIRSLCEELNLLVPFCATDTDTISTPVPFSNTSREQMPTLKMIFIGLLVRNQAVLKASTSE